MNNVIKEFLNFYLDKQMYISRFKDDRFYQKNKNESDEIEEKIISCCTEDTSKRKMVHLLDQYREKIYGMEFVAQSEMFEFAFMSGLKLGIDTQKIDRITEQTSSIIFEETVENSK